MIYRKLIEDIHVVVLRGRQMVNYKKNGSSFVIAQLLKTV